MLNEILERNARRFPNKTALVFQNQRFTFSDLNERVNRLVNGLSGLGVRKGDRIAIAADTCPQHLEISCAGMKAGTATALLNPGLGKKELIHLINNAEPHTVVLGENYKGLIDSLRPELKNVKQYIVIGDPQDDMKGYEALLNSASPAEPKVEIKDDDLLFLLCSGGTTGLPKQIMYTHRGIIFTMLNMVWVYGVEHEHIFLFTVPAFWAQVVPFLILPHFYMGCSIVMVTDINPQSMLEAVQREKITSTFLGSPFLPQLLEFSELNNYNYSSLRRVLVAGTPLPSEVWERAVKTFGRIFAQIYGLCEMSPITYLPPEDFVLDGTQENVNRLRSCGKESINSHARVVNEQGQDISPGEVGEVIAKGEGRMAGYWNAPQATQEAIREDYLYTGDMATIDEEGYIFLVGRRKDIITSGGKMLSPSEIEDIIYRHPAVQEVAVIGVPDDALGEAIEAVVVLKEGEKALSSEIIGLCQQHLPPDAVPQSVDFVVSLPKSAVGKILKHKLREKYTGKRS
ncbi:MAG: AMP-binding protein [Desulfobacteraceae bacterium]|nr:AMP-binding protein [Desulfobacteraceae bacterium]